MAYSGGLQPKKKAELQQIASDLHISEQGTKEDLQNRIKTHLEQHQASLADDPKFMGLYHGRRKRSVQPQHPPASRFAQPDSSSDEKSPPPPVTRAPFIAARRAKDLGSIREDTPANDLRDVSVMLKKPFSPNAPSTAAGSPLRQLGTPSSLPPLPPSPSRSILDAGPRRQVEGIVSLVRRNEESMLRSGGDMLWNLRTFLSNSRNIWSLTAVLELLYLLYTIIPWKTVEVSLTTATPPLTLVYPPWTTFITYAFWRVLGHWSMPTLFIPALFGMIISFNPADPRPRPPTPSDPPALPRIPFDPLTASIIRLAAEIAYPFAAAEAGTPGADVLGLRWRALSASVGVAFAFSEAIAGAPALFAKSAVSSGGSQIFSGKRALMGEDTVVGEIE